MKLLTKMKPNSSCHGSCNEDIQTLKKIVLAGAPNVGKSMVFNKLTGTNVTVSNYPGTTVSIDKGKCKINDKEMGIIDLPGMYSLNPITEEERIAKLVLLEEEAEVVLHVVDAKNLERMLPLTLQLIEAELPVVLVVNMMDEAEERGIEIDFEKLEDKVGVPVVPMIATSGQGTDELIKRIEEFS